MSSPKSSEVVGEPTLTLRGVSKRFFYDAHRTNSVRDWFIQSVLRRPGAPRPVSFSIEPLDLTIARGDALGLIGRNGSGKSTLLRLMSGIYQPTSGEVVRTGTIAAVLELGAGFHDELSGADNIATYTAAFGLTEAEVAERFDEIVDFAGVAHLLDKPIKHYSTGMQARLALSVALCVGSDILLLDEALSVGDRIFRRRVWNRLERFRENGGTLVLVSHDLSTLAEFCNRGVWLDQGRIVAEGKASTVLKAYRRT
jgi:ABC-type polysaccharide/polyol phosphate transport system ATPase subunit